MDKLLTPVDSAIFSEWYLETLAKAEICDYSPVRGCMVIRPYGYAIWELMQQQLNSQIKAAGAENAYFPLFIPESFIKKEKKHVEGFSPELAVVTHAGGEELEEPLVVRPTSETIIYHMFAKWIKTHRDLPLKINQWANVVRWEKRTKPFLRTTEFLWQEGHTAHITEEEAFKCAQEHLKIYVDFMKDWLAVPVLSGPKTESEKFAGAKTTLTFEAMMRDGKALQSGTSHLLENSFPKAFDVAFQDTKGEMLTPWCTSWGITTRALGAMIMVHGSIEEGFILPPKVAPIQIAIVPIRKTGEEKEIIDNFLAKIEAILKAANIRYKVLDDNTSPGARFFYSESKGIPFRIEFGMRDVNNNMVVVVPRLASFWQGTKKLSMSFEELKNKVTDLLNDFQQFLFQRATDFLNQNTFEAKSFSELTTQLSSNPGFYKVDWCKDELCEAKLKEIQATLRVVLNEESASATCFACSKPAKIRVIAAKSY